MADEIPGTEKIEKESATADDPIVQARKWLAREQAAEERATIDADGVKWTAVVASHSEEAPVLIDKLATALAEARRCRYCEGEGYYLSHKYHLGRDAPLMVKCHVCNATGRDR